MTGITPWASGSAGRLLFLEALTLSSRFGETAREVVFLIAQINPRMSAYGTKRT